MKLLEARVVASCLCLAFVTSCSRQDAKIAAVAKPARISFDNFPDQGGDMVWYGRKDALGKWNSIAAQFLAPNAGTLLHVEIACTGVSASAFNNVTLSLHADSGDSPGTRIAPLGTSGKYESDEHGRRIRVHADGPEKIRIEKGGKYWLVATSSFDGIDQSGFWFWNKSTRPSSEKSFPRRAESTDRGKSWKVEPGSYAAQIDLAP
jgi:hypothetical protein